MAELLFTALVFVLLMTLWLLHRALSRSRNQKWLSNPSDEGKFLDCSDSRIYYRVRGKNEPAVIIMNEPGSSTAEWWPVQNELGMHNRTICFERPGYTWSKATGYKGDASGVCALVDLMLKFERVKKPVILIASGSASLYARFFAAEHPESTAGMLLINPTPPDYKKWLSSLKEYEEYVYPEDIAKRRIKWASHGLYRLLSPLKGYKLDKRYRNYITEHYTLELTYKTQLNELSQLHASQEALKALKPLPNIPVRIIYSGNESQIREQIKNGVPEYTARQISRHYRELSREYGKLTARTSTEEIEGCGELMHVGNPKVVAEKILEFIKEIR